MARKLSFSVESILGSQIPATSNTPKNNSSCSREPMECSSSSTTAWRPLYDCHYPCSGTTSNYHHNRSLSLSVVPDSPSPLSPPPSSPLSIASAPSPITESLLDDSPNTVTDGTHSDTNSDNPSKMAHNSRKGRMRFNPEQIQALEQRFQDQQYLLPADRKVLSVSLRMTERQIKTWFQNKRAQYKRTRPLPVFPPGVGLYHPATPIPISASLSPHIVNPMVFRFPAIQPPTVAIPPTSPFHFNDRTKQFPLPPMYACTTHSPVAMGMPPRTMYAGSSIGSSFPPSPHMQTTPFTAQLLQ